MKLSHMAFRGEVPILDPRLLPEQAAQTARNVDLRRGTLRPERAPGKVDALASISPVTLYRYPYGNDGDGFWFTWNQAVDVVPSPLANDEWQRVYWTGDDAPKMAPLSLATSGSPPYPGSWYDLGVPAPSSAPGVSAPSDRVNPDDYPDMALDTAYVVTYVTEYGEEGPPSDPSASVTRWDPVSDAPAGGEVEVSLPGMPSGSHAINHQRLYRVESGGVYQWVADLSGSATHYTDARESAALGGALPSLEWDAPDPRLRGLTALPGGILAGFFDNTLAFCEAYRPHAWPVAYQLALPDHIVGIASIAAGLLVVTQGRPQLVTGSSPAAMAPLELDVNQPCVSARSVVDMGDMALYASPEGLVAVGGQNAQVVTRDMLTREQWQALNPATIHAYRWEGAYLAFHDGGAFLFRPGESIAFFDLAADGGYYDITDDTLYLVQGDEVTAWREGEPMAYTWRSRIHELPPGAAAFSCGKVIARDYPVTLRVYADGALMLEHSVSDAGMFRLPPGYRFAREWQIELAGTAEVQSVQIATTPDELV